MNRRDRTGHGLRYDAGAGTAEYLAILGVVATIVGAVVALNMPGDVSTTTSQAVCTILGNGDDCGESSDGDNDVGGGGDKPGGDGPDVDPDDAEPASEDQPDEDAEPGDDSGNTLPSLCNTPQERSSNSNVSVPGNGPTSTAAAWGYSQLANLVIDKINNEKNKEKRVKAALDDLSYCLPDYNIVIAKAQDGNLQEMDGSAMIQTVEISGEKYRIYAFKSGKFTWAEGNDLGWKNRGFHGNFEVSEDRRTVTFEEKPRPKRKPDWKPGDEGCQVEGQEPPDRSRYYNTYSPLDNEGSSASVRMLVNDMRRCYPDYNVVAMHSEQKSHWEEEPDQFVNKSRYRLNSTEYHDDEEGNDIESGRAVFDVYVFDKGKFKNDGDGGHNNWALYGDFERGGKDDKEVEFDTPDPADLKNTSEKHGNGKVNFNDGAPKYTDTDKSKFPGTDYDGKVPGDKDKLNQSLIEEYRKSFPDKNIITAKSFDDMAFSEVSGLEHLAVVDGVDVFAIDDGTVTNKGDGGWKNWGFGGNYDRDEDDDKTVTFKKH
ncbi:hypothetical protein [Streptomyces sp. YIM 130001]|uniref:hypothetical protein n=1 Tax=Streptomyces sp. YIM 130001 TaxID=2259644 RepID=UPI0013C50C4F|nr:hypothetical protein [Streptomyces sp. YIM 130001]